MRDVPQDTAAEMGIAMATGGEEQLLANGSVLEFPDKSDDPEITLVPVVNIRPALQYDLERIPGAACLPFVAKPVRGKLEEAAKLVAQSAKDEVVELVLWDAHRSREVQRHVVTRAIAALEEQLPELSKDVIQRLAFELLGNPSEVFPHGTGGAIGVTLAVAGQLADMGSPFGDFGDRARRDFYCLSPPKEETEQAAMRYRQILDDAMTSAGFWGHDEMWWHYELGTERWARSGSRDPLLSRVLPARAVEGPAARPPVVPTRYSAWRTGVGPPFLGVQEGAEARSRGGHFYARYSHPGGDALADFLAREIFGAEKVILTVSGHSAATHAARALLAKDDRQGNAGRNKDRNRTQQCSLKKLPKLLIADDVYQGSKKTFREWGGYTRQTPWLELIEVKCEELLDSLDETIDVVYVDSPSNWHLKCHDLGSLAEAVHVRAGAKLIVDITLQPCQDALQAGADLVVCSLSKDISLGHTMAGAIAGRDLEVTTRITSAMTKSGELVTPETTHTIHQHAYSLRDRLHAQAKKVQFVGNVLKDHGAISSVHTADTSLCCELTGSQMTFELCDARQGPQLERVVGQRSLDPTACLHLAGTFGAVFTTLEHLASRGFFGGRAKIPDTRVRLGLGCESPKRIAEELVFALNASAHKLEGTAIGLEL